MPKLEQKTIIPLALRFLRDDGGAASIEYAMIASGIAVAIAAAVVTLGSSVNGLYSSVLTAMKSSRLARRLLTRRNFPRAESIGEPRRCRARLERLLLIRMRPPS
jgi:pilus assembly protein Flp/PilA